MNQDRPFWARHEEDEAFHFTPGHWSVTEAAIRERAYFISLETGGSDPRADWLRAEAEFAAEAGALLHVQAQALAAQAHTPHPQPPQAQAAREDVAQAAPKPVPRKAAAPRAVVRHSSAWAARETMAIHRFR